LRFLFRTILDRIPFLWYAFGCWVLVFGCWGASLLGVGCWVLGCWLLGVGCWGASLLGVGCWFLGVGFNYFNRKLFFFKK
jgi:hypothetical protein